MKRFFCIFSILLACICESAQLASIVLDSHATFLDKMAEESNEKETTEKKWEKSVKIRPDLGHVDSNNNLLCFLGSGFETPSLHISQFRSEVISPPPEFT